ncbi:MAG: MFS transporter [Fuerstiella sp.]
MPNLKRTRAAASNLSSGPSVAPPVCRPTIFATTIQPYLRLPLPVLILCLGSFINRAGSFAMLFLTIYISEHLHYGVTFAANCFGVFGLGSVISSMAGGHLADHFGRKPVMLVALFGGAVTLILLSVTESRWGILSLMLAFSLTMDMYRPAASAMVGDLVDTLQRPLAFGLMYIAFNLGFAVAAPVGGFLAEYSFRVLFWGDALTTAAYGLMIVFLIRETLPSGEHVDSGKAARASGKTAGASESTSDMRPVVSSERVGNDAGEHAASTRGRPVGIGWKYALRHIAGDTTFLLFSLAALLTSIVFMQGFSTLPMHLSRLGFSKQDVGLLLSTNGVLIVVLQIPLTQMLNRFHRVLVILTGELLIAVGFGLTTIATAWPLLFLTVVIWTVGEVVQAAFKQSMVADLAPVEMRGRYMGVFALCHAIGLSAGVPLGGQILQHWGPQVLWPACAGLGLLAAGIYVVIFRRRQRDRSSA